MRPSQRIRWLRRMLLGVCLLLVAGLLVWPLGIELWVSLGGGGPPATELSTTQQLRSHTLQILASAWCFWVGAAVGSFLNVVVYRTPRGLSLVSKPSNCPFCKATIQARDNVPILGWLMLGGRCRSCRLPISPRYPIVEAVTACLFLGLYFIELISGGANLPVREPNLRYGVVEVILDPQWDLIGLYAYHVYLLVTLLVWSLIRYDGHRIPLGCLIAGFLVGVAGPLIYPGLQPVPWSMRDAFPEWTQRFATSLVGTALGVLLGFALEAVRPQRPGKTTASSSDDQRKRQPPSASAIGVAHPEAPQAGTEQTAASPSGPATSGSEPAIPVQIEPARLAPAASDETQDALKLEHAGSPDGDVADQAPLANQRSIGLTTESDVAGVCLVGLFLGWQALISTLVLTGCLFVLQRCWLTIAPPRPARGRPTWPWLGLLGVATCLQLVGWRWLSDIAWWPGPGASVVAAAMWAAVALILHGVGVRILSSPSSEI